MKSIQTFTKQTHKFLRATFLANMATTQVSKTNSHIVYLPDDVRQFENDAVQTICCQLQKVLAGSHKDIELGDKDCLKKIIVEMVKHRLDDPTCPHGDDNWP